MTATTTREAGRQAGLGSPSRLQASSLSTPSRPRALLESVSPTLSEQQAPGFARATPDTGGAGHFRSAGLTTAVPGPARGREGQVKEGPAKCRSWRGAGAAWVTSSSAWPRDRGPSFQQSPPWPQAPARGGGRRPQRPRQGARHLRGRRCCWRCGNTQR